MTLKERVIVETYTGYCMTSGEERNEVYKYMHEIMGRPVYTHELASKKIQQELHEKSKADFVNLCRNKKPTAYDLEEVVKQIEDYRELIPAWALKEIIEIVKGGMK